MSRIKQTQNIDNLVESINEVTKNRYSLSDENIKTLNDAKTYLLHLKKKKGKTNEQVLNQVVKIVHLLTKVFIGDD